MKGRTLAALAVVALLVVGYAVFQTVGTRDAPARTPRKVVEGDRDAKPQPEPDRRAPDRPDPERKAVAETPQPRRAPPPPPQPAKPNMTVDEAREKFDAYIAELDREIKRGEEVGRPLSNEAWVDLYKQGHEAIDPLIKLLDRSDPAQSKELGEKQELMRKKLWDLQPRSAPQ